MRRLLALGVSCVLGHPLAAQIPAAGFSRDPLSAMEYRLNQAGGAEHPSLQPAAHGLESSFYVISDSSGVRRNPADVIVVRPVFDGAGGLGMANGLSGLGWGYGGAVAEARDADRWSASAGYALAGGLVPGYVAAYADSAAVLPGWGAVRGQADRAYFSHMVFGHAGVRLGQFFHVEAGKGKHFWGDGRRSLLLSDVASPYPYLRIDTRAWKIKYTNLWARMDDISGGRDWRDRRHKYVAMHALSWNVTRDFNLTLSEAVVWQDQDTLSRRNLDLHYLIPVLFYRPVEFAQGSADNVILALGMRGRVSRRLQLYGQLVVDEFLLQQVRVGRGWWANKVGGQLGMKWFDVVPGLHLQWEGSVIRPFTYTHGSPVQAWGHLNQPLAHPMGANLAETMLLARYSAGNWSVLGQLTWAAYGRDRSGKNEGGDIFKSYRRPTRDFGNILFQGTRHSFHFVQVEVSRSMGANRAVEWYASWTLRYDATREEVIRENMLMAGVRMSGLLRNRMDF